MLANFKEILSVTLVLFSVIDILGAIPIVLDLRKKTGNIHAGTTTLVAGGIMIAFLYIGTSILSLFGVDVQSFAVAGALIIFLIGLEMTLGHSIFKMSNVEPKTASIVPLAFPIIAGAGTMTTILSLKAQYGELNILIGIFVNLALIYLVLRSSEWIEKKIGAAGTGIIEKIFGVILLAIAIKLFRTNLGI
ncbi:MAG: MarC family protein [Siphonobacter sp.]